jgi:hypothetical protein
LGHFSRARVKETNAFTVKVFAAARVGLGMRRRLSRQREAHPVVSRRSSGSGSVSRERMISQPSVVGKRTSIICTAANFCSALRAREAGSETVQPARERDLKTIGEEGDEDVRFDALLVVMGDLSTARRSIKAAVVGTPSTALATKGLAEARRSSGG